MLHQFFRRGSVRSRIEGNPIGPMLGQFVEHLGARGHHAGVLHQYVFAAEHFGNWLRRRSVDAEAVDRFVTGHLPRCSCPKPSPRHAIVVRAALRQLLRALGLNLSPRKPGGPCARLLLKYEAHLRDVGGLSDATVPYRLRYAREFLDALRVHELGALRDCSPARVVRCVSRAGRRLRASSGQVMASSIRSFLRFLLLHGLVRSDLASAVPSFASWRLATLPAVVTRAELERLVSAVDPSSPNASRDRAVLLCLTELGLRAAEVAAMTTDGVDLVGGVVRLRNPKQRETIEMPIPVRLRDALAVYLRSSRPKGATPALFVKLRAPIGGPLKPIGIRGIVVRSAARAGLADRVRGSHVLRHSVASELINAGAPLKQIADLLGHRSIDTTALYAKVDLRSLARVALPWPGSRAPEARR
jgi:site-specific recombinase XerD